MSRVRDAGHHVPTAWKALGASEVVLTDGPNILTSRRRRVLRFHHAHSILGLVLLWIFLLSPLPLLEVAHAARRPQGSTIPAVHLLEIDDRMVRLAAEGGYQSIVQVFPWRDIEPTRDEWHWQQSDFAVQAASYYDLGLIVRLDHPPDWAVRPADSNGMSPIDLEAYANFVATVARRYRGQVRGYIVWNEPNLSREWANQAPDPAAYTALLCHAHASLKAVDPDATVVSAGLAPTNGGDGALDDRLFLREMLQGGALACFDVLGAHAYGFGHPPDDAREAHDGLNLARLMALHEITEAYGGRVPPIWITELGWTSDGMGGHAWQTVSPQQQANYLAETWRVIRREWPWVQLVTIWNLSQGLPKTDEMAGYSLLSANGSPKPAYLVMRKLLMEERNRGWASWVERLRALWPKAQPDEIPILAADEVVHLGDDQ